MPQLIVLALIGGVLFVAVRAVRRQMRQVADELERRERVKSARDATPLHQDADGIYRPQRDDE